MDFCLIETLGWTPVSGFGRLDLHLARLERSARHFGWRCDTDAVLSELNNAVGGTHELRVRLQFSEAGVDTISTAPFFPLPPDTVWTIGVSAQKIDASNQLLRYKTTRREVYERARADFASDDMEEVILLNDRDEVCEGTITTIFIRQSSDGPLLTPALDCGLLAGVLREEAIARGLAREAVFGIGELRNASEVFVGNSLRGFIRARLAGKVSP